MTSIVIASAARTAIYLRVSTGRQAEHDLSIPDQRAQTEAWVAQRAQRGWRVVAEYVGVAVNMAMGKPLYLPVRDRREGPLGRDRA